MAGRPREFDRDLALQQAMLAFWQHGYEGTSMADLVAATGLASARLYAAFGSKEDLFREAVARYEEGDGAFAEKALQAGDVRSAVEHMLRDAVLTHAARPSPGLHGGVRRDQLRGRQRAGDELAGDASQARTQSVVDRIAAAARDGELAPGTDIQALGDYYAAVLHGLSVQARDGVGKARLLALIGPALAPLDAALR